MEEGRQKSKRLSYTAKFKREVIPCAEDKGNRKVAAIFRVMKATFDCGGNTRQRSAGVWRHERNSLDPRKRKDDFPKLMMQSSSSFVRDARLDCLRVMMYFARRRQKKARYLNIPRSRFKSSKGWGHKPHAPDGASVAA